ncbi:MAG: sugar transferase, partial [Planctomycetes bacterium]|nr:sugar transferase [Planctomycetota bacterium]
MKTTAQHSGTIGVGARGAWRTLTADAGVAERALALVLLLLALPMLGLLALFVLAADGWPAFYSGERLGRGRRPFTLYKLRTLKRGAEKVVGGGLLGHKQELVIRGGTFLRDTRLDELPQLWNVVCGDMALLGPRPERAEVYRAQCAAIPGYARRFDVRPGLIGVSQLFTPHATDKRYRTLLDNHAIRRGNRLGSGLVVIAFTVWAVAARVAGDRGALRAVHLGALRARTQQG